MTASPSFLANLDACPRALDHYEARRPRDVRPTAVGTAAHEVLYALAEGRDVSALCAALAVRGASDGAALPVEAVAEGRSLAFRWVERYPIPPGQSSETLTAFNAAWRPCEWTDPAAHIRLRMDATWTETVEDEDGGAWLTAVARDYKTSWADTESALESIQMRAQAVALWLTSPDAAAVRIEIANLRRLVVFERTIPLDEDGVALLTSWRDELDALIRAAAGPRAASPGVGCGRCWYVAVCDDAADYLVRSGTPSPEEAARRWLAAKAVASEMEGMVKDYAEAGPIAVPGGSVGYVDMTQREASPGALHAAVSEYLARAVGEYDPGIGDALRGLLVQAGEPSLSWMGKVLSAMWPGRDRETTQKRKAWIEAHTESRIAPRLKVVGEVEDDEG